MKKNLIYTLCILLSGSLFFNSCEDMLDIDSERVDHEFNDLTLNDSVYSVLGILKSVQNIADRHIILGELRGDLVTHNESKAVLDLQSIAKFEFDAESNPYLAVKDYYEVINNCNVFLQRVDTTIERSGDLLMLREFVAVKSIRAWTYLQLAINYNRIPYFTEPLLTHSAVADVMSQPLMSREDVISKLIEELTPYENPRVYPMPEWTGVQTGAPRSSIATRKLFMPIRMLLGELHLWRAAAGDYSAAANYYYKSLTDTPLPNGLSGVTLFTDNAASNQWPDDEAENPIGTYAQAFQATALADAGYSVFGIPMETSTTHGTISYLSEIFAPQVVGEEQLAASLGYVGLSNRQDYYLYNEEAGFTPKYNPNENMPGDLRRYAVTGSRYDFTKDESYNNVIGKFNLERNNVIVNGLNMLSLRERTNFIIFARSEQLWARFAEALLGMERFENIKGGTALAMSVLKEGLDGIHPVYANYSETVETVLGEDGLALKDAAGNDSTITVVTADTIRFDFTEYANDESAADLNAGLHSRGSGVSKYNRYYALNDTCIARYYGLATEITDTTLVLKEGVEITDEDRYNYVNDLLIDELALEFCFEGNRFGDLIRFAKKAERAGDANWRDVLAKRVAGRNEQNSVPYNYSEDDYIFDGGIYGILSNENNWYLPLPGKINLTAPEAAPAE